MMEYIYALDARVLENLFAIRDPLLVQVFIWISELGGTSTIYGLGSVCALLFLMRRHVAYAAGLGIALASSGLFLLFIKGLVARARPPESFQAYQEVWYSFPSAHAALSVALYGFLAYAAWHLLPKGRGRYIALSLTLATIVLVPFSRLYLGVHYASDVLAGLVLGAVCVWFGIRWVRFTHTP